MLPPGRPISFRAEARDEPGGTVRLRLFVDGALVLEVADGGVGGGVHQGGFGGVRNDFMDVELQGFRLEG